MKVTLAALGILTSFASNVYAVEPGEVYSPHVDEHEWEVEARSFTIIDRNHDENRLWNHHFEIGYGVDSFWWTELVAEYEKPRHEGGQFEAFEWENRFQFTEQGRYFVDVGGIVELEKKRVGNGKEVKVGLLLEKDIANTTLLFNWLAGRGYGDESSSQWEQEYRAQWRWRWLPAFEPLVEMQADEHAMNVGPGFTGKARIAGQKIAYTTAWLMRATGDTPRNLLRFQVEFEF